MREHFFLSNLHRQAKISNMSCQNLFTDKIAVITGGARGIGFAIAKKFARKGAKVALISRSEESSSKGAKLINEEIGSQMAFPYFVDIADFTAVQEIGKKITQDLGNPSILVNNAGITRDGLLMRMKEEDWDAVINANLKGAFNSVKAFQKSLLRAENGRIINISSVAGIMGNAGQANYASSKAGLIGFTKTLAREFASRAITCNAIAPGFIETQMTAVLSEEIKEKVIPQIPAGAFGKPEDIANAVLFLAKPSSSYITGQILAVDGGMTM